MGREDLTDAEWEPLRPFLPVSNKRCCRFRDHRAGSHIGTLRDRCARERCHSRGRRRARRGSRARGQWRAVGQFSVVGRSRLGTLRCPSGCVRPRRGSLRILNDDADRPVTALGRITRPRSPAHRLAAPHRFRGNTPTATRPGSPADSPYAAAAPQAKGPLRGCASRRHGAASTRPTPTHGTPPEAEGSRDYGARSP